jgi:hypothetical protein
LKKADRILNVLLDDLHRRVLLREFNFDDTSAWDLGTDEEEKEFDAARVKGLVDGLAYLVYRRKVREIRRAES